jgi:glycerol-3-phosphate O-acyltransferase
MVSRALAPTYEPNPLLAYLYRRFFDRIRVDEAWVRSVREAAARGSVVYVLRNLSYLDFLALDHLTRRHELPRMRFANDLGLWVLEPMGKGWLGAIVPGRRPPPAEEIVRVIEEGGSAALFLKRPQSVRSLALGRPGPRRSQSEGDDLVRALFELQRGRSQPIFLLPQVFVWSRLPDHHHPGLVDALLGTREWPGKIRTTLQFFRNYKSVSFRAGEPVDLCEYLKAARDEGGTEDDAVLVRRLTYAMLRKLERERRAIVGPATKSDDRVRAEVLKSPKLRSVIRDLAGEGQNAQMVLTQRAFGILRELSAQPEPELFDMLEGVFDYGINRIYDGIEVDEAGLDRVRQAARRGTLVLLPSHKSHVDYMLVAYVCHRANLQMPLVAAGDNLSFFPAGPILRRAGGFFIRRSFGGDRLYGAVVDAYIRRLIREGHSIEFYLEGGRSRSGKLLPPKVGLLNMVVEGALSVPHRELFFVPISIGYDRIVEGGSYVHEATGGEKEKENARGLLRTTQLLRGRYGRLSMQFGQVLALDDLLGEVAGPRDKEALAHPAAWREEVAKSLMPAKRRALVTKLAHRVMAEINRVTPVTPGSVVAMALLASPARSTPHAELVVVCARLVTLLRSLGAPISRSFYTDDQRLREAAVEEAARLFVDAGHVVTTAGPDVVYSVPDDKRLALDLSKNNIVHFLVPRALVAAALVAPATDTASHAAMPRTMLEDRVRTLSRLFKYEFMFRADATFEENFVEALRDMTAAGELSSSDAGEIGPGRGHDGADGRAWIEFYAAILRTFLEGYRVAARSLTALLKGPMTQKDLVRRGLATGERMFLDREIGQREAVNRLLLSNAWQAFADQGYVTVQQGKLALSASFATADAVATIEGRILDYLMATADAEQAG